MQEPTAFSPHGYSARVDSWLEANGLKVPLSHTAKHFVIAAAPTSLPQGDALIVGYIDNKRFERPVYLFQGMSPSDFETPITPLRPPLDASSDQVAPF